TDNAESIAFILGDSGAALLLVDSRVRWSELVRLREQFPELRRAVCLGLESGAEPAEGGVGIGAWLGPAESGHTAQSAAPEPPIGPDALACIVYTSGTTGRPKGVMLSHRSVLRDVHMILDLVSVGGRDVFLSF